MVRGTIKLFTLSLWIFMNITKPQCLNFVLGRDTTIEMEGYFLTLKEFVIRSIFLSVPRSFVHSCRFILD